jgi:hypothetical protein
MSFLKPQGGAAFGSNAAASGLGRLMDVDPSRISQIAQSIGGVANGFANAGGATPGYAAPEVNNHMQLLDPEVLRSIMAKFRPGPGMGVYQ